jgi:hypothetical protein
MPRGFLGMVALIALSEAFFARNDLKFSSLEAHDWKTTARSAAEAGQTGGLLCFGDSQLKYGVLPLVLESRLGQPVQSLAILGGQAPSTYFLLRKALESGARPSAILVCWEPHLLQDGPSHNARVLPELADFSDNLELSWAAGDSGLLLSTALGQALPSYRERFEIRDNIKAAFHGETPPMGFRIEMAWRNKVMNRGAVALAKDHAGRNTDLSRWGNPTQQPWKADPTNTAFARRFLGLAKEYEIPVFVVLMPVSPGMQRKYEQNGIDLPYTEWVRKLGKSFQDLVVLDLRNATYDATVFYDALHLDRDGAVSASLALGDHLRRHLDGQPSGDRWVRLPSGRMTSNEVAFEDTTRTYQIMSTPGRVRR